MAVYLAELMTLLLHGIMFYFQKNLVAQINQQIIINNKNFIKIEK